MRDATLHLVHSLYELASLEALARDQIRLQVDRASLLDRRKADHAEMDRCRVGRQSQQHDAHPPDPSCVALSKRSTGCMMKLLGSSGCEVGKQAAFEVAIIDRSIQRQVPRATG